jgi:hypothetical protein
MCCNSSALHIAMDAQPQFTMDTEQQRQDFGTSRPKVTKHKSDTSDTVKRTVKYLSVCKSPRAYSAAVHAAPDGVIQAIANAAYNIERGPIYLSPSQKALFRTHRQAIATLTSPRTSVKRKRKVAESQKGGFPFLPILIGSALGALGSRLFGGTTSATSNQQQ